MDVLFRAMARAVRALLKSKAQLVAENLALRHQLDVLRRKHPKRPNFDSADRLLWVWLSRLWRGWRQSLVIVKPQTVIKWHREGFRRYWRDKCRPHGRPPCERKIITLIHRMCRANPGWGAPRIHGELAKLGIHVAQSTVSRYMLPPPKGVTRASQSWATFIRNHMDELVAVDFLTVPTATFRVLYCFVILSLKKRKVLHFNVTAHPTAEWAAQQMVEAFAFESPPKYLIRDRDGIYGKAFRDKVHALGMTEKVTACHSVLHP